MATMALPRVSTGKTIWLHYKLLAQTLVRMPAHLIPSLAFPALLYLVFAVPHATNAMITDLFLASFAIFSVLAIVLYQFGIGIAAERESPWEQYVRSLPASATERLLARSLVALTFVAVAIALMSVLALTLTHPGLDGKQWALFVTAVLLGSLPFAALGIFIGYIVNPRAAIPIANLIYLPLSYLGGILTPPQMIPKPLSYISPFMPTRESAEIVWGIVLKTATPHWAYWGLAGYFVVFSVLAVYAYRRDEGARFS